jgi:D-alanyl-D-alanine dipeptidase
MMKKMRYLIHQIYLEAMIAHHHLKAAQVIALVKVTVIVAEIQIRMVKCNSIYYQIK